MKNIGRTDTGNRLVEMTNEEFNAIHLLIETSKGKPLPNYIEGQWSERNIDEDTTRFLNAVYEWMQISSRANELRHLADRIDMAIKVPESPRKETQDV